MPRVNLNFLLHNPQKQKDNLPIALSAFENQPWNTALASVIAIAVPNV
jgi:hypothetical protein